MVQLPDKNIVI